MRESQPGLQRRTFMPAGRGALAFKVAASAAAGLALVWASFGALDGSTRGELAAAAVFLLSASVVALMMRRSYPHPRMGACNVVTLMRAALVCALLAPLIDGHPAGWGVAAVASLALLLDGVDGWLARREGLVSRFGARFDIEVDAALALVLSLHVIAGTAVGAEILVLGLTRYTFVAATFVWPWLAADLPESQRRKRVCVLQIATLIVLQTPLLAGGEAILVARITAAALIWSFAVDVRWLREHRR